MANAAAKKAAAAKAATANVYLPILIGTNVLYVLLLLGFRGANEWNYWVLSGMVATWGLQGFAYMGILDQAASSSSASGGSLTKKKTTNNSKNAKGDLVGGAHLDLLGLTVLVQYGSVLHTPKWFYLLWIAPIWGAWALYSNFAGKKY